MTLEELNSLKVDDMIDMIDMIDNGCLCFKIVEFEKCWNELEFDFCKICPGSIKLKNLSTYVNFNGCRYKILEYCKIYHQNIEFITEEEFKI